MISDESIKKQGRNLVMELDQRVNIADIQYLKTTMILYCHLQKCVQILIDLFADQSIQIELACLQKNDT